MTAVMTGHEALDEQIGKLTRGIKRFPRDAHLYLERGDLHRLHGNWAKAVADCKRARQLNPRLARADLYLGKVHLDAGQPRLSLRPLDRFLIGKPRHVGALVIRARALALLGEHLRAVEDYTKAIDQIRLPRKPRPGFFLERARALVAAGEEHVDTALASLDEGVRVLGPVASLQSYATRLQCETRTSDGASRPRGQITRRPPVTQRSKKVVSNNLSIPPVLLTESPINTTAVNVTRGPYLQLGTPTSLVVRWRTREATDSVVRFSRDTQDLTEVVSDSTETTEHVVSLTGLEPDSLYHYAVGTSTALLASGSDYFFFTAPDHNESKPTRIWVLGDSGTANNDAAAVRDAYHALNDGVRTDLWLMLGDNAYGSGTDRQYQAAVFDLYPEMLRTTVLWPTLGNHDGISADSSTQSGPYYEIFTLPTLGEAGGLPSGTEAYYSFDYSNIHFVCLDSHETRRTPDGAMLTWLRQDLEATTTDWVIAFWHHPPYSKGSHDSDREPQLAQMRRNALPILEEAGVDLVLCGHSHSYERSFLLDGHYGKSKTLTTSMIIDNGDGRAEGDGVYEKSTTPPPNGAVYVVAGSSGKLSGGRLNHPAMFVSLASLGSLVLDVDENRLDARFLDETGRSRDHFTLVKSAPTNNPPIDDTPVSETAIAGITSPTLDNLREADGVYASLQEVRRTGARKDRQTFLEHRWHFEVSGGSSIAFHVKALRGRPRKGREGFAFSYSTDGVTFLDMLTVTKKHDGQTYQIFELPASVSGPVDVRVVDTKRKRRERSRDVLLIDHMFIRSCP